MIKEYIIENAELKVTVKRKGAELSSVIDKKSSEEFMWQAGEEWPRHAPNLFPIVGSLLDHEYIYEDEKYPLSHHGFARDLDFDMLHQSEHSICFVLECNDYTFKHYPFIFSLLITYTLKANSLTQTFRVINGDSKEIPISFGGHPAFNARPVDEYYIVFSEPESVVSNRLSGPYINEKELEIIDGNRIELTKEIFEEDALIFQQLNSEFVSLKHKKSKHQIKVNIKEWPYLGIWSKPGAPYVCIEPWQGLADFAVHDKNIRNKKGIIWLQTEQEISKSFNIEFTPH